MLPQYQVPPRYQTRDSNTPVCTVSKAPKSPSHKKRTIRKTPPHRSPSVARYTTLDSKSNPDIPISVLDALSLHPGESEKFVSDEEIRGVAETHSVRIDNYSSPASNGIRYSHSGGGYHTVVFRQSNKRGFSIITSRCLPSRSVGERENDALL